jgi:uncharacterized protein (DUF3820 family)
MTDGRLRLVQPILNTFENEDIKAFAIILLDDLPDYIWHVGASSTGKYHPAYSLGDGGLMRHQIAVVRFLNFFLELEQYGEKLTSRERDLIRLSGLIHDGRKSGSQEDYEKSKYTKFNHPVLMADVVRSFDGQYLTHEEIELIADTISKHMGQFNTDKKTNMELPKPNNKFSRMVHVADYLASRKCLTMDFEGYEIKQESIAFDENYTLTFGKYTGRRLIDVYNSDPGYLSWCDENLHKPDLQQMIKAMKEYLKNKENEQ